MAALNTSHNFSSGTDADGLASYSRLLERVAGEFSRLTFQCKSINGLTLKSLAPPSNHLPNTFLTPSTPGNRGKDLAFVRVMETRISGFRSELELRLSEALKCALEQKQEAAQLHCLHAYVEVRMKVWMTV